MIQTKTAERIISSPIKQELSLAELIPVLLVAGTGFLVDVYDIAIFFVVRVSSLKSLGVQEEQLFSTGVGLLNLQVIGMVLGAFIWGVLGDKKGRKFALFGSILLYSIATFLNGFVHSVLTYGILRFIAGIGLAGEVGAAITIAAEVTPAKYRGYATGFVRSLGLAGALLASLAGDRLPWRMAYLIAGSVGFLLLFARMSIKETDIFAQIMSDRKVVRGSVKLLLLNKDRLLRLVRCVLAAMPYWFVFGVLIAFAPEVSAKLGNGTLTVSVASATFYGAIGTVIGEMGCGVLSQILRSRKKAMLIFLAGLAAFGTAIFKAPVQSYAFICFPLGLLLGYFSVILTTTAEQFGTNLRSTSTILVPNLVRTSVVPITLSFSALSASYGVLAGATIVGSICLIVSLVSILQMEETFARDLNFVDL